MEILVQESVSEPQSRRTFAKLSTEVIGIEDVVKSLSEIIDDENEGYQRLPLVSARSEGMERLDVYSSLKKTRADQVYIISNGRNTIYMLNYVVSAQRVYHDPVVCMIGPDASKIAEKVLENLSAFLVSKMYNLNINDEVLDDFLSLTKSQKNEVTKEIYQILDEADMTLKMRLLGDKKPKAKDFSNKELTREILEEVKYRKQRSVNELFNLIDANKIIFGIVITLIILILILALL